MGGPFLQEAGGISSSLAAGLTSSVTIGFLLGLIQGNTFSKMESVDGKMNMIRKSYVVSFVSTLGLTLWGLTVLVNFWVIMVVQLLQHPSQYCQESSLVPYRFNFINFRT